jgi:lysophospholipase L1-like esterase
VTARFLALGDSYTIGEGVAPRDGWPTQLAAAIRVRGKAIDDPVIVARTGWTTSELLAALDALRNEPGRDFALVSLLIGVNDQYRGRAIAAFHAGFDQLLERAVDYAARRPSRVLVLSIPDWGVTPFASADARGAHEIAAEIDELNRVACDRTRASGARFVDVTRCSRLAAHDATLLASDGLHPSAKMYARWAALALPEALSALAAQR